MPSTALFRRPVSHARKRTDDQLKVPLGERFVTEPISCHKNWQVKLVAVFIS
jgi:hypothetical protein